MNIIKKITAHMIDSRGDKVTYPCKVYQTEAAAEKATANAAQVVGNHFDKNGFTASYLVIYVAQWDRWIGAINLTEVMNRASSTGGYLGIEPGFYKF